MNEYAAEAAEIRSMIKRAVAERSAIEGAVRVRVVARRGPPASAEEKQRHHALHSLIGRLHVALEDVAFAKREAFRDPHVAAVAREFQFSPHARDRRRERGFSIAAIYGVIAYPDSTLPGKGSRTTKTFVRGDIAVAADPETGTIVTVIDRQSWRPEE